MNSSFKDSCDESSLGSLDEDSSTSSEELADEESDYSLASSYDEEVANQHEFENELAERSRLDQTSPAVATTVDKEDEGTSPSS